MRTLEAGLTAARNFFILRSPDNSGQARSCSNGSGRGKPEGRYDVHDALVLDAIFGAVMNDTTVPAITTKQITLDYGYLHDPATNLLFHAYAEDGASWLTGTATTNRVVWGRAMGWFIVSTTMVLGELLRGRRMPGKGDGDGIQPSNRTW